MTLTDLVLGLFPVLLYLTYKAIVLITFRTQAKGA
mgnify:CR=1 FL=1|jgi:hypothetical protein